MVGGMMKSFSGMNNPLAGAPKPGMGGMGGMMPTPSTGPNTAGQGINTGPSSGMSGAMMGALPSTLSALSNSMGGGGGQPRGAGSSPFSQMWANQPFQNANAGGFMPQPQQPQQDNSAMLRRFHTMNQPQAGPMQGQLGQPMLGPQQPQLGTGMAGRYQGGMWDAYNKELAGGTLPSRQLFGSY